MNETEKTYVAYCRISKADLERGVSLGLEDQIEKVNSFFNLSSGKKLLKVFVENGVSAKNIKDRPVFREMLEYIKKNGVQGIVVNNVTRLSRRLYDVISLVNNQLKDVELISLDMPNIDYGSPVGTFILQNLACVAELERNLIIQRTRNALNQKKKNNETLGAKGREKFGYRNVDGRLVERSEELTVIQQVKEMRSAGMAYKAISEALGSAGFFNRAGNRYAVSFLCKIALAG